jgi:hypothetical protein
MLSDGFGGYGSNRTMRYSDRYCGSDESDEFCRATYLAPQRARELLSRHPHFYGRVDGFKFEWTNDVLVVKGTVPTYYLKQLLQNALRQLGDVRIDDRVNVVWPEHGIGKRWRS